MPFFDILVRWNNDKAIRLHNKNISAIKKRQQIIDENKAIKNEAAYVEQNNEQTGQKRHNYSEDVIVSAKRRTKINLEDSVRYDLFGHFPDIDRSKRMRCKNDGCQLKTSVFCIKCNVYLCFVEGRNCFKHFHYKKNEEK